jgi:hypothetical protein
MSTEAVILMIVGLLCSGAGLILFTTTPADPPASLSTPPSEVVMAPGNRIDLRDSVVVPDRHVPVAPHAVAAVPDPASATPSRDAEGDGNDLQAELTVDDEAPAAADEVETLEAEGVGEIHAPPSIEEAFVEWHRRVGFDPARAWRLADDTDRIRHKHSSLPEPVGKLARLLDIVEYEAPEVYAAEGARDALLEFLKASLGPDASLLWPEVGDLAVGAVAANAMTGTVSDVVRPGFVHTDENGVEHRVQPVVNRKRV